MGILTIDHAGLLQRSPYGFSDLRFRSHLIMFYIPAGEGDIKDCRIIKGIMEIMKEMTTTATGHQLVL